jgi:hypothetical protein
MFRVIKGELIKKQRGERSLREVAKASDGAFSDVSLYEWEKYDPKEKKAGYKPKDDKVPALLRALGCSYEDITEPAEVALQQ